MDPGVSNIYGIWLFPILLYFPLAVILDRKLYQSDEKPIPGRYHLWLDHGDHSLYEHIEPATVIYLLQ